MEEQFAKLHLQNQLCFPLYAASRLTTQIYGPFLKELDLTYPQYLVMLVLWEHQVQTVNQIGNRLLLESNTLTPLLKRLEQKKLISRMRSETDERSVIIRLTDRGHLLQTRAVEIPDKIINSFKDHSITEQEIVLFMHTIKKVISLLSNQLQMN
ncbi:MAG TPA: MarR family transcriptional regulator [Saprospiraceae bacterium]|nr:MarR family transcriptional regulator [Saprospirales bacterium]HRQ28607.1 MarR family transcriptional regulator [Saprospiraceae bacterium]